MSYVILVLAKDRCRYIEVPIVSKYFDESKVKGCGIHVAVSKYTFCSQLDNVILKCMFSTLVMPHGYAWVKDQ